MLRWLPRQRWMPKVTPGNPRPAWHWRAASARNSPSAPRRACASPLLKWSWPSLCFLFFMIPLPYSWEGQFAYPLQRIATLISMLVLQLFGQTAFAEDTTILIGQERLHVKPLACCGIRLFMTTFALVYAWMAITNRTGWEKLCLMAAAVPVALVANATRNSCAVRPVLQCNDVGRNSRILTRFRRGGSDTFAVCLLWLMLWYLGHLFPKEDVYDAAGFEFHEAKLGS